MSAPWVVRLESPVDVAMPKSVRQACPSGSTSTLAGLTSRCTMPARVGGLEGGEDVEADARDRGRGERAVAPR